MSSIKNITNFYRLNTIQLKGLKIQLNKLDLNNRLMLTLNKKIEKFPHNKVSDNLGGSLNQNIIFNFSNKNANTDRRLINNKNLISQPFGQQVPLKNDISLEIQNKKSFRSGKNAIKLLRSKVSELGPVQVKNPARLSILNFAVKIITSFFKRLSCLIARPQFIHKTDKIIVRVFYYQNNFNKDALFFNNKLNFIYNLFNGTYAAKAQYNAPKTQNFRAILLDMLGQTKWNKIAQTILDKKNNDSINILELANISKKVFILFIKDFIKLTASNKRLSIEKALTKLQKGTPTDTSIIGSSSIGSGKSRFLARSNGLTKRGYGLKKYNQLLRKLISSTNSESLTRKRTRLSKSFFNKSLLLNLTNKVNNHNKSLNILKEFNNKKILTKEIIGKGLLLNPINKKKLDTLLAWSNMDLSDDYKIIATALLLLLNFKENNNNTSQLALRSQIKLANKINNNLISLSTQFDDEVSKNINFIINKKTPTFRVSRTTNIKYNKLNNYTLYNFNKGLLLKVINLINKQFSPTTGQKGATKYLTLVKETLKAYNYGPNSIKNGFTPSELISNTDNVNKFKLLGILLTKIFKKNIDVELIRVYNAGLDSEILAKFISLNARGDKTSTLLKKIWRKITFSKASLIQLKKNNNIINANGLGYSIDLANKVIVPGLSELNNKKKIGVKDINLISNSKNNISLAQLHDQVKNVQILNSNSLTLGKTVGLSIRIAGRLKSDPSRPKQTVKKITVGSLSKERSNTFSIGSSIAKNRKGTFKITVKMAHSRTFSTDVVN